MRADIDKNDHGPYNGAETGTAILYACRRGAGADAPAYVPVAKEIWCGYD